MTTYYDVLAAMRNILNESDTLQDWCLQEIGAGVSAKIVFTEGNQEIDYPFINISFGGETYERKNLATSSRSETLIVIEFGIEGQHDTEMESSIASFGEKIRTVLESNNTLNGAVTTLVFRSLQPDPERAGTLTPVQAFTIEAIRGC